MKPVKNLLEKIRNYCWVRYLFRPKLEVGGKFVLDWKEVTKTLPDWTVVILSLKGSQVEYGAIFSDEPQVTVGIKTVDVRTFCYLYKKIYP